MKSIILILFLSTSLIAQNSLSIGIEVAPMFHTQEVENLQTNSFSPNFVLSYGSKQLSVILSIGVLSRVGFISSNEWVYARGTYTVNTLKIGRIEHGAEIEVGFNYVPPKQPNIRINIGSSIGLLTKNKGTKLTFRPLVVGFLYKIL
jgi:hypothetical protein